MYINTIFVYNFKTPYHAYFKVNDTWILDFMLHTLGWGQQTLYSIMIFYPWKSSQSERYFNPSSSPFSLSFPSLPGSDHGSAHLYFLNSGHTQSLTLSLTLSKRGVACIAWPAIHAHTLSLSPVLYTHPHTLSLSLWNCPSCASLAQITQHILLYNISPKVPLYHFI